MLGACVAHADNVSSKLTFARQLGFLAADEDGYFQASFATLGVSEQEADAPELSRAAAGFRDLMYDAVNSADYRHLLVMLVIAEWLYLDGGERDLPLPEADLHLGWIELHRGEEFAQWAQFLIDELNRVFPEDDPAAAEALQRRWEAAVSLELDFFDVSYERAADI